MYVNEKIPRYMYFFLSVLPEADHNIKITAGDENVRFRRYELDMVMRIHGKCPEVLNMIAQMNCKYIDT